MTAATVRRGILEPTLDAQALNATQARLIANPTPEVDSLVEHVTELARTATTEQRQHLHAILTLTRELFQSNQAEGDLERTVAGAADHLTSELRNNELNADRAPAWPARRIARMVRGPLADLLNPVIADTGRALQELQQALQQIPTTALLTVAVRHELGCRKYTKLTELHAQWASEGK